MPERATVFQQTRIGFETTPGTPVTPTRKPVSFGLTPQPQAESRQFRPIGTKFNTINYLNREWMGFGIDGVLTYNEIVYLLACFIENPTPVQIAATGTWTWTFDPSQGAADTVKTFTAEQGDASRAHRWASGIVTAMNFSFTRNGITLGGSGMGQAIVDDVALTGTPTEIVPVPVQPSQLVLKMADTQAGLTAAPALTRGFRFDVNLGNRFSAIWPIGSINYPTVVEMANDLTGQVLVAADDEHMPLLTKLRDGTKKFFRITATEVDTAPGLEDHIFQIDLAAGISNLAGLGDNEGVYAATFDLMGVYDPTWANVLQIKAQSGLATL